MKKLTIGTLILLTGLTMQAQNHPFVWQVDQFADARVIRCQFPEFEQLSLNQKIFSYYLSEAALSGRDITYDQNYKHNLLIRDVLERIYSTYTGDRKSSEFAAFETYLKRFWFAGGVHHHYSNEKFTPGFTPEYYDQLFSHSKQPRDAFRIHVKEWIFNLQQDGVKICKDAGMDLVQHSAGNYYEGVTQKEAEDFYAAMADQKKDPTPPSYGLNSKLVKENGVIQEKVWKVGGMYSKAIEKIISDLKKALPYAQTPQQAVAVKTLIRYYQTGDLDLFDAFNIQWLKDGNPRVDFVNGFTEVYGDPLARKGAWEALVNYKDIKSSKRVDVVCENAQWFEDHSPIDPQFRKEKVVGVSAKVINYIMLGGDAYPTSPLGINLPNSAWIRRDHGSKSVSIQNISYAIGQADAGAGKLQEFLLSEDHLKRAKAYGDLANNLSTDLHECLGHGSAKLAPGIHGDELKNYSNVIEEARATLFSLYFLADQKIQELGIFPSADCYKAEYDYFMTNALLMQLARIQPGKDIVQAHMRCRKMIAEWVLEKAIPSQAMIYTRKNGKTYVEIKDYKKVQELVGQMLKEVQRIKSTGDYAAAQEMVEKYGVKIDPTIHQEVLARTAALNIAGFTGFMNPRLELVRDAQGKITDVKLFNEESYVEQNLRYSRDYHFLPNLN